ncbi:MAG: energy-coupling factor transporter transmembrane protein EcfT [Firmicutes bacterium]|nr:energy-coupling factor transporter transmembrane protein EcfT [Bacillota bacterium]
MKSVFSTCHPAVNFGWFCAVIGIGIFLIHPVFLTIAVLASICYALLLGGKGTLKFIAGFLLPMILVVTVVNALVNPRGSTVLLFTEYSQITMEAGIYGLTTGLMLATILLWFSCYNRVMTSDKFMYLFGKLIPAVSLIFSMVMRFVPNFKMQIKKISEAQRCIGRDVTNGRVRDKIHHGILIVSIMFTWALENAIDSADSMRSRGYGLKNRSTFSIFRFDRRDLSAAVLLVLVAGIVLAGMALGKCSMEFYPQIVMADFDWFSAVVYGAYGILCFFPVLMEVKEVITWKRLQSKI